MKDGLWQYSHGNVCAGFTIRNHRFVENESAPIMRKIFWKVPSMTFWKRSKWIAPLYEGKARDGRSPTLHRS